MFFLRLAFELEWLFYLFSFVIVNTEYSNNNTISKHNNVRKVGLIVDSTVGHLCSFWNKNGNFGCPSNDDYTNSFIVQLKRNDMTEKRVLRFRGFQYELTMQFFGDFIF